MIHARSMQHNSDVANATPPDDQSEHTVAFSRRAIGRLISGRAIPLVLLSLALRPCSAAELSAAAAPAATFPAAGAVHATPAAAAAPVAAPAATAKAGAADEVGEASKADAPLDRGTKALEAGRAAEAVAAFSEAIQINPKSAEAYVGRGRALVQLGEFARAMRDLNKAIELEPANARWWWRRGEARLQADDEDEALADFARAIELDPKLPDVYVSRAALYFDRGDYRRAAADETRVIELRPDDPQAYIQRAETYRLDERLTEALADLTRADQLRPNDPRIVGERAAICLQLGRYDEGMKTLRRAIELNDGDAGRNYRPHRQEELSAEALRHGREQVERMLRDRPPMAQFAEQAAFLRDWAARKFAGEDVGEPVFWDPAPPTDSDAEHIAPTPGKPGRIMIDLNYQHGPRRGKPRTFEELWSRAVFELHNIGLAEHFVRLHREAQQGKITKRQFVFEMWKHEEQTMQLSRAFYLNLFLPFAAREKLSTDPDRWFALHWQAVSDEMLDRIDRAQYPWRPYARQYDWQRFWALYQQGEIRRAMRLLEGVLDEPQHPTDRAEAYLWLGRCRLELGRPAEAIELIDRCLQLDPNHPQAAPLRRAAEAALRRGEKKP